MPDVLAPASAASAVSGEVKKMALVWAGTLYGISLSDIVLLVTLVYTALQIGFLLYDRLVLKRKRKDED